VSPVSNRRVKVATGLLLGLAIGAFCRYAGIPSPAPPVITGALLVFAMTAGYAATDWWLGPGPVQHRDDCGGPDGSVKVGSEPP